MDLPFGSLVYYQNVYRERILTMLLILFCDLFLLPQKGIMLIGTQAVIRDSHLGDSRTYFYLSVKSNNNDLLAEWSAPCARHTRIICKYKGRIVQSRDQPLVTHTRCSAAPLQLCIVIVTPKPKSPGDRRILIMRPA